MLPTHAPGVRSAYRELLRLIAAQPSKDQAAQALAEARATLRARAGVTDPQLAQHHHKELVARVSFLRITTPRQPGTPLGGGKFVWREGELVEGEGEDKGSRVAASSVSVAEARRLNAEHYKRFYGKAKAKDMFF